MPKQKLKFSPGLMAGITFGNWLRLLVENRFAVAPHALPAAGVITGLSLANSLLARIQDYSLWRRQSQSIQLEPPVFILGLPRSGTTMLQHMLAQDQRYHSPTLFQVRHPFTFLVTQSWLPSLLNSRVRKTRAMDNVQLGWNIPDDDEFATALIGLRSSHLGVVFPRRRDAYEQFYTFDKAADKDRRRYQHALLTYVRWLTAGDARRLLLKSPVHTGRISLLQEIFPTAQFVMIHRHPVEVFRSLRRMVATLWPGWGLQAMPEADVDQLLLARYGEVLDLYFKQRAQLPAGQLVEVAYRDLEADPIQALEQVYQSLNWDGFQQVEPGLRAYLEKIGDYRKNRPVPLPPELHAALRRAWQPAFAAWGYSDEP